MSDAGKACFSAWIQYMECHMSLTPPAMLRLFKQKQQTSDKGNHSPLISLKVMTVT